MTWAARPERRLWAGGLLTVVGLLGLSLFSPATMSGGESTMMGGRLAPGMVELAPGPLVASARPLSGAELRRRLEEFAATWRPAVTVQDVMPFANHTYAVLVDRVSGQGRAEVLVNRYSGTVSLEPGPSMFWTIRTASPGGWTGLAPASGLNEAAAREAASTFLTSFLPGARVGEGHPLAGYYTFDYRLRGDEGMVSVNVRTGQVWPHTWHGPALPAPVGRARE